MSVRFRAFAQLVAVLGMLLAAACTGQVDGPPRPSPLKPFNQTDLAFARQLVRSGEQAIALATTALSRAEDPAVRQLAAEIVAAHTREIQAAAGWVRTWEGPSPPAPPPPESPMPGVTAMPAFTPAPDPDRMADLRGADFDRMFLQMMISNHQRVLALAEAQRADGVNPHTRDLAARVDTDYEARVAQMRRLLSPATPTPR